jgi:hypothetical protein
MQLALLPPVEMISDVLITGYRLALAHMLLNTDPYYNPYRIAYQPDPHAFRILDNGAAEGALVPDDMLIALATEWGFDEIVIPDVLLRASLNVDRAEAFLKYHTKATDSFGRMFVAQGHSLDEIKLSIRYMLTKYPNLITTIGLPRNLLLAQPQLDIRIQLVMWLADEFPNYPVHCLGANDLWATEVRELGSLNVRNLRGIDTSLPYVWGLHLQSIRTLTNRDSKHYARPANYFSVHMDSMQLVSARKNVDMYMSWVG